MPLLINFEGCNTCSLKLDWPKLHSPVMPMTSPREQSPYRVMILGEGPGKEEDEQNRQFVGKTGQYLREYMPKDWINKVYWNNVVRCRPTSEDGRSNRAPTEREIKCCSVHLKKDILDLRPHAILGIGAEALNYFWGEDPPSISKIRGIPFPIQVGDHICWLFCTYHPSYVVRAERENWGDGTTTNPVLPVFKHDLRTFFDTVPRFVTPPNIQLPPKNIVYPKSYDEAMVLYKKMKDPYARDYETTKLKPYHRDSKLLTAAYSDGNLTFAFPVNWPGDTNPWGMQFLKDTSADGREWVAQHAVMELIWTMAKTGVRKINFHDLEVVARLNHKRSGLGSLDVISRIYLGVNIKELTNKTLAGKMLGPLDKSRLNEYSLEQILEYNGLDSWSEIVLFKQLVNFLPDNQFENYLRSIETIKSTAAMELYGLPVDLKQSEIQEKQLLIKMKEYELAARQLPEVKEFEAKERKPFSLSKTQVLAHVLINYCGIELENTAPRGAPPKYSVDEEIIEKLADKHPLIPLRLNFVEVQKLKSTYVLPILNQKILGVDGLLHPSYKVIHTKTYRLSSEDPNQQNWPHRKNPEVRRQVVPPPGYMFLSADYGQLEARVLAMASKDQELNRSIINNEDIHSYWLNKCIDRYPQYMDRLRIKTGETEEKKVRQAGRTIIKTDFVFASFYGSIAKSIANRTAIPLDICNELLEEFWYKYKGAKTWIDGQHRRYQQTGTVQSLTGRIRDEVLPGNEVINTPIQGSAAEIVLEGQNALHDMSFQDFCYLPRISVHDCLDFFVPEGNDDKVEYYIKTISDEMVKPRFSFITTPLMVEFKMGYNWCDLIDVGKFTGSWYQNGQLVNAT